MYFLKVMRLGQPSKFVPLDKFVSLPAEHGVSYQIVDSTGQMAEKVINFGRSGESLIAATPDGTTVQIEGYFTSGMTADMQYPQEFLGSPSATAPEEFMSAGDPAPGVETNSLGEAIDASTASINTAEGALASGGFMGSTGLELAAGLGLLGVAGLAVSAGGKNPAAAPLPVPTTPTISTVATDNQINLAEQTAGISITGKADPGTTVTLSLAPGLNNAGTADNLGNWRYDLLASDYTALGQGVSTFTVFSTSSQGVQSATATLSVTIDTIAPTLTMNDLQSPTPTNNINIADLATYQANGLTVTGTTDAEVGQPVTINFNGGNYAGTVLANGTWSVAIPSTAFTTLIDGVSNITVNLSDAAGNPATQVVTPATVDTAAPTIAVTGTQVGAGVGSDLLLNASEISTLQGGATPLLLTGTTSAEVGQSVTVTVDFTPNGGVLTTYTGSVTAAGVWNVSIPPADAQALGGAVTLPVTANVSDLVGNPATAFAGSLVVDPVPPTIALSANAVLDDGFISAADSAAAITVTGTTDALGRTVTLTITDGTTPITVTAVADAVTGAWAANFNASPLADGPITVSASISDLAGNPATATHAPITKDTMAPPSPAMTLTVDSGIAGDFITNDASLTIPSLATGDTRSFVVDGGPPVGTYNPLAINNGAHTVQVIDTDQAGNTANATINFTLDNVVPTMTFPGGVIPGTLSGTGTVAVDIPEAGTVYMVDNASGTFLTAAAIEALPANQWTKVNATGAAAPFTANLSVAGLVPANYDYYAVDAAGNLSPPALGSTAVVKAVTVTVDLTAGTITASDASTNFSANVDYTIDIISPANSTVLNGIGAPWTGGANLGAGDVIHIIGPAATSGELQYVNGAATGTTAFKATAAQLQATPSAWNIMAPQTAALGTGSTMLAQLQAGGLFQRRTHVAGTAPAFATGSATLWTGAATFGLNPTLGAQVVFV